MSELNATSRPQGQSRFWRIYLLSWAFLAGGALSYLSIFALHPDGQARLLGKPLQSDQESNRAELDRAQLTQQVRTLHETVASLRSDLARVKDKQSQSPVTTASLPKPEPSPEPTEATAEQPAEKDLAATSNVTTASIAAPRSANEPAENVPATSASLNATPPEPSSSPAGNEQQPYFKTTPAPALGTVPTIISAAPVNAAPINTAPVSATSAKQQPTTRRRGRNLATIPLRAGKLPPLPGSIPHPAVAQPQQTAAAAPANGSYAPALLNSGQTNSALRNNPFANSNPLPATARTAPPAPPAQTAAAPQPGRIPAFGRPAVTAQKAPASAALSLSTASSVTGLRASWLLLTSRHPGAFLGYQPRYVANEATGTYQLVVGPIASRAEADRLCTDLRADSVSCGVTDYVGSPL